VSRKLKKNKGGSIPTLIKDIASSFSSDSIGTFHGKNSMDIVEDWIPSKNIALNYILGDPRYGAFPQGKITEIFGPKSSAKSLILYDAGAQCQKMGGIFILVDSESSFHKGFGKYLGINYKRLIYASLRTIEEIFDFMIGSIVKLRAEKFDGPILMGWDSVAASTTSRELDMDYEGAKAEMGNRANLISKGMREFGGLIYQENVTSIIVNQIRHKIGVMFGNPETRPGGNAIPFHASIGLHVKQTKKLKKTKNKVKRIIGHEVEAYCEKNRVRPPFGRAIISIFADRVNKRYGLDKYSGLLDLLLGDDIIQSLDKDLYCLTSDESIEFTKKEMGVVWKEHILPAIPEDLYSVKSE